MLFSGSWTVTSTTNYLFLGYLGARSFLKVAGLWKVTLYLFFTTLFIVPATYMKCSWERHISVSFTEGRFLKCQYHYKKKQALKSVQVASCKFTTQIQRSSLSAFVYLSWQPSPLSPPWRHPSQPSPSFPLTTWTTTLFNSHKHFHTLHSFSLTLLLPPFPRPLLPFPHTLPPPPPLPPLVACLNGGEQERPKPERFYINIYYVHRFQRVPISGDFSLPTSSQDITKTNTFSKMQRCCQISPS